MSTTAQLEQQLLKIKLNRKSSRDLILFKGTPEKNHEELMVIGDILARRFPDDKDFEMVVNEIAGR